MKLHAKIDGEKLDVEIIRSDGHVTATVDGREYTLDVSQPEPNIYKFRSDGKLTEVFVSPGSSKITAGGHEFEVNLIDPKRLRGSGVESDAAEGIAEIKTAMSGKVVRILVTVGDDVQKGDGVLVIEAMKMQNEIKSPKDGVVREIRVAEDGTVSAGDVLIVVE